MKSIREFRTTMVLLGGMVLGGMVLPGACGAAAAQAPDPADWGHGSHGDPGRMLERMTEKLGLSAEQQTSIKAIMDATRPQMRSLHQQIRANAMKLHQTPPDDPNYASLVSEVSQTSGALASKMVELHASLRTQMYATLTPAQKQQFTALEAQHLGHRHGRAMPPAGVDGAPAPTPPASE